jgi:hypothetical protein
MGEQLSHQTLQTKGSVNQVFLKCWTPKIFRRKFGSLKTTRESKMSRQVLIRNDDDLIDVRDIIARVEELEEIEKRDQDEQIELTDFRNLLRQLAGNGGDEQWRGDWYPVTLIRCDYFPEYVKDLVTDIGDLPRNLPEYLVIDWEATAANLKVDYSEADFDSVSYYYR